MEPLVAEQVESSYFDDRSFTALVRTFEGCDAAPIAPASTGIGPCRARPLAVEDVVDVLVAALVEGRLPCKTVGLVGPTELGFDDSARLVANVIGSLLARLAERTMTVPLLSVAQVSILEKEVIEATLAPDPVPNDLTPATRFDSRAVRAGLPDPGPFHLDDLR